MSDCKNCREKCGASSFDWRTLTESQAELLLALEKYHFLPVCRFAMASTKEDEAWVSALEPVYIVDETDDREQVQRTGMIFTALAEAGLITLDYDQPLGAYAYEEYKNSALYAQFAAFVAEGSRREGFLFDTPVLETGSAALTNGGRCVLADLHNAMGE